MKKYVIYAVILIVGLVLGWLLFGNSNQSDSGHDHSEMTTENQLWTCSMHPQIMQPEPGDCPICGMDLIPAEAGADGLSPNEFKLSDNAMALANIQTSIVGSDSKEANTVKLSGKISANENANVIQASYFSGRIERLNISSVGEEVRKGQLLATIYSPELFSAQQELITAAGLKESQPDLYSAVRNKLKLWKISEDQINQIEASGQVIQNFPIYATVSGTVSEKLVDQGDYVQQGQALLSITNLNSVWGLFDVYENQVESLRKGQEISITTNAYPDKKIISKVDFIDPMMNPQTRTVNLRVVLNNSNGELKTGMFVEGLINIGESGSEEKLMIPATSVLWTGERSIVYIKSSPNEPVFAMREIVLGRQTGDQYEVREGLKNGDVIVTNGTFTVDASAQLQGKKSMMNKSGDETMDGHEGHSMDKMEKIDFNSGIERSFVSVIDAYIDLKDALIQSDASLTANKLESFKRALEEIPEDQREQTHSYWSTLHNASQGSGDNLSLEEQRKIFQTISDNLIDMVRNFDELDQKLFVQFCPMADNNNGAFWISKEEQVLNPYFGDAMLKCGTVKEIFE